MIRNVFDKNGGTLLRAEDATPGCTDFCEACGDCLACFGDTPCYSDPENPGEHHWVKYEGEAE